MTKANEYVKMIRRNEIFSFSKGEPCVMANDNKEKNKSFNNFLILIIAAVVLVAAVTITIFFLTRDDTKEPPDKDEYLPQDYGDEPSGLDDEYTARY